MIGAILQALDAYGAAALAAVLIASAAHKLVSRDRLRASLRGLSGLSERAAVPVLPLVALIELGLGAGLLAPSTRAIAALTAATLWSFYATMILRAVAAGRTDIDCGCSFGARRESVSASQVWRNLILIATALITAIGATALAPLAAGPTAIVAGLAFLTLYAALDQVAALKPVGR